MIEKFKTVPDTQDRYMISNWGYVVNMARLHGQPFLKRTQAKNGALTVGVVIDGKRKVRSVSKMVMQTFKPDQASKRIKYKDGDRSNCRIDNIVVDKVN